MALQQLLKQHTGLQTGKGSPKAEVLAEAERQMALVRMVASDIEAVRVLAPNLFVSVRGPIEEEKHLSLRDPATSQLRVLRRGAGETADWRPPAQHLLHRVGQEFGFCEYPALLVGVPHQEQRAARDQVAGRLVARGEERCAEYQDLGVCEVGAFDFGASQSRDKIVLRCTPALAEHALEVAEHLADCSICCGAPAAAARFDHGVR